MTRAVAWVFMGSLPCVLVCSSTTIEPLLLLLPKDPEVIGSVWVGDVAVHRDQHVEYESSHWVASKKPANDPRRSVTRIGAVGYAFTRSPDAADLSIAAMTSWRRTASAKSGTV